VTTRTKGQFLHAQIPLKGAPSVGISLPDADPIAAPVGSRNIFAVGSPGRTVNVRNPFNATAAVIGGRCEWEGIVDA